MGWYIRQSVRIGPVRFNFSKSGIGTSVGVKGFRVGVRPNGTKYVHAGGYGVYYREELGSRSTNANHKTATPATPSNVINYNSAKANNLVDSSRKELLDSLNKSYKGFRIDYLIGFIFLVLVVLTVNKNTFEYFITAGAAGVATVFTAIWESKRRTVFIDYDFDENGEEPFKRIINAFNNLASNNNVWFLINRRNISGLHESKLNAGAGNITNRSNVIIGEGKPPWVDTNIDVPLMKTSTQSLYMMPDGILIYDVHGVGFVDYKDILLETGTTRFIEENPPKDSKVVDRTWKYPNKKGGPDRRFNNNYEIPICQYGELKIESKSGLFLYLMTSKNDTPTKFKDDFIGSRYNR